jgi:hypothetical protein
MFALLREWHDMNSTEITALSQEEDVAKVTRVDGSHVHAHGQNFYCKLRCNLPIRYVSERFLEEARNGFLRCPF